jgi:uncharacterized protein YbbC (DUF1343 family)
MSQFQLGIDRLLNEPELQKKLLGKRLSLLGHPASVTSKLVHSLDALKARNDIFNVTSAFGPQHGMRGEKQDNMHETPDEMDPRYKIPIFSLYSHTRRPTDVMMKTFDVLLVDMQDVGTRIYTFLTTLLYVLEACAKHDKEIWVLDRPNPAGRPIEGTRLEKGWVSFVGAAEGLPMRHGLTLGEAARWFVDKFSLKVKLTVVEMKSYHPDQGPGFGWPETLSWLNPSPNAATLSMARAFPGTVLIEGTNLSEGRGTTRPLEIVGGPGLDMQQVINEMKRIAPEWLRGCVLRECFVQPTFHKHVGQIIPCMQIHVDHAAYEHQAFKPYRLIGLWLKAIRNLYPKYDIYRNFDYEYEKNRLAFDLINGGPFLREWIENPRLGAKEFDARALSEEASWASERKPFLLY